MLPDALLQLFPAIALHNWRIDINGGNLDADGLLRAGGRDGQILDGLHHRAQVCRDLRFVGTRVSGCVRRGVPRGEYHCHDERSRRDGGLLQCSSKLSVKITQDSKSAQDDADQPKDSNHFHAEQETVCKTFFGRFLFGGSNFLVCGRLDDGVDVQLSRLIRSQLDHTPCATVVIQAFLAHIAAFLHQETPQFANAEVFRGFGFTSHDLGLGLYRFFPSPPAPLPQAGEGV